MTLEKLAVLANVSVSTASRALNNSRDISAETRERVLNAAEEYGYFRDKKRVRAENRRPSELRIAIICPEIISRYYSGMALDLINEFRALGCNCTVYNSDFDERELYSLICRCRDDYATDAIICFSSVAQPLCCPELPIVVFGDTPDCSRITVDITAAFETLLISFKTRGIKTVAFVGENHTSTRLEAFRNACKSSGLICIGEYYGAERFERAGAAAAARLLKSGELPQGVVCAYDEIALGLTDSLTRAGIRVPEDIAVAGMNDIPTAKYVFGGLTTLRFEFGAVCRQIAEDIISDRRCPPAIKRSYKIPFKLVERRT